MKKKYRMIHTAVSQPATPSWPNPGSTSTGPKRTHRVMGDPQCGGSHAHMSPPILFFFSTGPWLKCWYVHSTHKKERGRRPTEEQRKVHPWKFRCQEDTKYPVQHMAKYSSLTGIAQYTQNHNTTTRLNLSRLFYIWWFKNSSVRN